MQHSYALELSFIVMKAPVHRKIPLMHSSNLMHPVVPKKSAFSA